MYRPNQAWTYLIYGRGRVLPLDPIPYFQRIENTHTQGLQALSVRFRMVHCGMHYEILDTLHRSKPVA